MHCNFKFYALLETFFKSFEDWNAQNYVLADWLYNSNFKPSHFSYLISAVGATTYIGTTLTSKFLHINTFYWLKVYRKPRLSHYSYLISINFSVNSIFLHDLENMMGQVIMQPPNLMLTNAKCLTYMIHPCKNSYLNPTYGNCFGQCM